MRWKLVPTGVAALAVILFAFAAAAQQQKPNSAGSWSLGSNCSLLRRAGRS